MQRASERAAGAVAGGVGRDGDRVGSETTTAQRAGVTVVMAGNGSQPIRGRRVGMVPPSAGLDEKPLDRYVNSSSRFD